MNLEQQIKDLSDEVIVEKSFKKYAYPNVQFKHDNKDYENYIIKNHGLAISFLKDTLKEIINVNKFWFEIILAPSYHSAEYGVVFPYVLYALYPRETHPDYSKCDVDGTRDNNMARYITWQTGDKEIRKHKRNKLTPDYFILSPRVYTNPKALNLFLGYSGHTGEFVISQEALNGFVRSTRRVRGLKKFAIDELIKVLPHQAMKMAEKEEELLVLINEKGKRSIQHAFKLCGIRYKGKYAESKSPRKNIQGSKKRKSGR